MNYSTETVTTGCPYCGETIEVVVDLSVPEQNYIEDCFVCCRPIDFVVNVDVQGDVTLMARHENE